MKEINLNGQAKIKLNAKGLKRVEELVTRASNTDTMSDYGKSVVIRDIRESIDEEGYLTNSLNHIMDDYDVDCFETSELTMQDVDSHEWFDLSLKDEVTVKLNGEGVKRTLRRVSEIERNDRLSDEDKKRMVDEIESGIDDNNNLTASLEYIINNYSCSCLENQIAKVSDEPVVTQGSK
ncbi:MAG: hypothetical protein K2L98_02945 [Bacilli bacterium]|nr:hypothetical protein [Bacilli bacterium]